MKSLAVIPARSGSKRIVGKNMADVAGKPMLWWTIRAALDAETIDHAVVSTDEVEIADYAHAEGISVHLRDKDLAGDDVPACLVVRDVLKRGYEEVEAVLMLLPTCPLRTAQDIDGAFRYWEGRDVQASLITVTKLHTESLVKIGTNGWTEPHIPKKTFQEGKWNQTTPTAFSNGAIQITSVESIAGSEKDSNPFRLPKTLHWELPWDRGIDVDTEDQLEVVRALMERRAV